MKIGVFDSGIGGESVANAIKKSLPEHKTIYINDSANVPYGTKTKEELFRLVLPLMQRLVADGCEVIVVACNTVTTTLIDELRKQLPVPLVGMEPMVKPAAQLTHTGVIAVCATPATLTSDRYKYLKDTYAKQITILEPDCSDWARMIEAKQINKQEICELVEGICAQNADVIVLGCTHYHWIEELIKEATDGRAQVLQPEVPVVTELKQVLATVSAQPA